jgi:hypothetical protein
MNLVIVLLISITGIYAALLIQFKNAILSASIIRMQQRDLILRNGSEER